MNNLLMISSSGHSSNTLKYIHMLYNSPNICLPWPLKDTLSFLFKNVGIPFFPPSANLYQEKISGGNINFSQTMVINYLPLSSHQTHITISPQNKLNHQKFSASLRVHTFKDDTISFYKAPKLHVKIINSMNI